MPMLTPDDRERMLGPTGRFCAVCQKELNKNYCRSCDEFFFECDCKNDKHNGHRTYGPQFKPTVWHP